METTGATLEKQATTQANCRHHWVIDTPSGPTSRGVCKVCGAEKLFQNYQFDFFWEDELMPRIASTSSAAMVDVGERETEEAA